MNTEMIAPASAEQPEVCATNLARWLGRREAFGTVAGRCSAADIECLRTIRNQRLFKSRARNWDEFCKKELRLSRRKIDDDIRHLEEFGPQFFQLAQLTRITPAQYRAIAQHVDSDGIHLDGQLIALLESNAEQIAAAVEDLRRRVEPEPPQPSPRPAPAAAPEPPTDLAGEILRLCDLAAEEVERKPVMDSLHRAKLGRSLRRLLNASARLGVYAAQ